MKTENKEGACPCGSGNTYATCCKPFHLGKLPSNALQLMRSRYSAYALNLPDYLIETTHPGSPQFLSNRSEWRQKIADFCAEAQFQKLEVLSFHEGEKVAVVTFIAHLMQGEEDGSFGEKSYFEKLKGKWFYRTGQLFEGHAPNLITTGQVRLLPLAYYGDPILRKVAAPIAHISEDTKRLVQEMVETMDACDGIGLAAPQVHHSVKLFVIRVPVEKPDGQVDFQGVKVFLNPEVTNPSQETWSVSEGCLSIPTIHADVIRPQEVDVTYTNLEGKRVKERAVGWEARIIMHENDHINGVLFIDRLSEEEKKKLKPLLAQLRNRIHDGTEL